MKKLALITLVVAAALGRGLTADTYPRQPGIRITNYTFDYTLTDASNELVAKQGVDVTFAAAGVKTIELDLCKFSASPRPAQMANGFADPCAEPGGGRGGGAAPSGGKGMTVTAVVAGDQALTWQHENDRVRVTLPRAFAAGDPFSFTVNFHGVPATGILIANNRHGDRGWVTNPWPDKARNFRAVVDHPSMKATHTTSVTAPRKYQVVSNGLLTEETDLPADLRRTVWRESVPISTWLMSLAVAPFAVNHFGSYRGIPLSSWVFPQEHDAGRTAFVAHTQPVLEFYIDRIGPYPYEKLAQVQANGVGGGMELASSIFYGYGAAGAGRQLIAHEMAHQYFGDAVTEADWDDVWLSEGFATYFALLYQEFADGHDAFVEGVRRSKTTALNYAIANPKSTIVHNNLADISRVIANNAQVYQGGAQVLQNIRGVVGTPTFWEGIRSYYGRYMNGTATTDDFRRAMEGACRSAGDRCPADGRDLTWLFSQLLNRGGALQVQGTWSFDATARQVQITLEQTQTTGLYRMPIEVRVTTSRAGATPQTARLTQVVQLTQPQQTFSIAIPADVEVANVELDPEAWVFGRLSLTKRQAPVSTRTMTLTFDDLPFVAAGEAYFPAAARTTSQLLDVLRKRRAPAIGFVNEGQLDAGGERRKEREALLQQWIDAGMTLGNHTYSHPDFNALTVDAFRNDIVKGEPTIKRLMTARPPQPLFFRHPMTHTGDTKEKKDAIDAFLSSRGYRIAPHTIENSDFIFNVVYVRARAANDAALATRVRDAYIDLTMAATAFAEKTSQALFKRDIPQTLLLHANVLTADSLETLLARFEARGYRFITLDAAMADPAYATPDTMVSAHGPTWFWRWARTLNVRLSGEGDPEVPDWVLQAYRR